MVSNKVAGVLLGFLSGLLGFFFYCFCLFVLVCCGFCLFVVVLGGVVCLVFCGFFWGFFDHDFLIPLEIPLLQQHCTKA